MFALAQLASMLMQTAPEPTQASFGVEPREISIGGSANLTWNFPAAERAYLSNVGIVRDPRGGTMTVAPTETTDYVIIMERGGEPTIMSTRLIVRGSKGTESDWPTPLFTAYVVPIRESSALKLVDLACRVRKILQGKFDMHQTSEDGKFDFYTAFAERSDLTSADERRRLRRRIAFRVELSKPAGRKVEIEVRAAIQYRVVIDRRWFNENPSSSTYYQIENEALISEILAK